MWDAIVTPFTEHEPMRRALVATLILSIASAPVGVFLTLRRMSLAGDALSHAVLPGVAVAFLLSGMAAIPMTIGAMVAGLAVALFAGIVTRYARQREDSSFAAFYLISLALGVLIVSIKAGHIELEHVLFGDVMALTSDSLLVIGITSSLSLVGMALIWRPLVAECLDPQFLRSVSRAGRWAHLIFLVLVVLSLVGAYQAMGSLLAVGLMMLPAAAAQFWTRRLEAIVGVSAAAGVAASLTGLLLAFHFGFDPAPAIILAAGVIYLGSMLAGPHGMILARWRPARHRTA
jgi:zinc/manganese transport system permease protein